MIAPAASARRGRCLSRAFRAATLSRAHYVSPGPLIGPEVRRFSAASRAGLSAGQRPLWASMSTKDPAFPDTMYVTELVVSDTVNTMTEVAVSRWIEHQTGWSIRKFVKTARRYRTVEVQAGPHTITAASPLPDDLRQAINASNASQPAHHN